MTSAARPARRRRRRRGRPCRRARSGARRGSPRRAPWACGPRPKTSSRRASGAASARTASAETAGVRRFVSAIPSTSATGASVGRVEDHADALDARLAADGHELDHRVARRRRRHHEQLAAADREHAARRVGLGVQARQQRGLERVDRGRRAQALGDVGRGEERQAHRRTKPVPERVARVEHEAVLAGAEGRALDLGEHALGRRADHARRGRSCRRSSRGAGRRPRRARPSAASSAQRAEVPEPHGERSTSPSAKIVTLRWCSGPSVLVEDRPVDARQPLVVGVARDVGAVERPLDRAAGGDQRRQVVGHDAQAEALGRHRGVDRAAVGHVDRDARRRRRRARPRTTGRCGRRRPRRPRRAVRTRATTRPEGTSIVTSTSPSRGAATAPDSTAQAPSAIVPCPHAVE